MSSFPPPRSLAISAMAGIGLGAVVILARKRRQRLRCIIGGVPEPVTPEESGIHEVIVVGAGPAGATAAYFLASNGHRVILLDRKRFPRVKICGDAWCAPALDILEEMDAAGGGNVLQAMERDGKVCHTSRGGFIGPSGDECIDLAGRSYGISGCRTCAIKRYDADEYLVRAAQAKGAQLMEEWDVVSAVLEEQPSFGGKLWRVSNSQGDCLQGRMLLVCDGSTSYLAQKLGLLPEGHAPEAVCSHRYVSGHNWNGDMAADGVILYSRSVLPGYSAVFRHADNSINLCTYILPGGKATSRAIEPFEKELIKSHPYAKYALGDAPKDMQTVASRFQLAPIRLGGLKRSYGEQVLIVGDAAGHVDPLTGEGIHTAMMAGRLAATAVGEMVAAGNYGVAACAAYHWRCWDAFVADFHASAAMARLLYLCPVLLDAFARVGKRKGQWFLDIFGECMTGVKSKRTLACYPLLLFEIAVEIVPAWIGQTRSNIGASIVDKFAAKRETNTR